MRRRHESCEKTTQLTMAVAKIKRRLSSGVELQEDGVAHARVWAPACHTIDVVLERSSRKKTSVRLSREEDGFFSGIVEGVGPGDRYWYLLEGERRRPDPVSRYQPEGPHGPSAIVDPSSFEWTDVSWTGVERARRVLYELHVGTFTPDGTWAAAMTRLEHLADTGITIIQMMPVADFAGRWGWGYDGVNLYAPTRLYGAPDDLRRFIDRAHALNLAVILDVVYNHVGPDGNYLAEFSPDYFTDRYKNDWGQALNFEGPVPARDFFVENAGYWIDEYHFDGLRLDATQDIHDASGEHVLASVVRRVREAAGSRRALIVAENEPQNTQLLGDPAEGGYGVDAMLNDDYHHTAVVALTGKREAYYTDYGGTPQELISAAKYGYLYQGQWYAWQGKPRGTPALHLAPSSFVHFLENHDQVANSAFGKRLHQLSSPGRVRALTALTLLAGATPLLFQGQEFGASSPFLFFADHNRTLRDGVREGRREFLSQFPSVTDPDILAALPAPDAAETFEGSRLDWSEREKNAGVLALHRDLLRLRAEEPAIAAAASERVDGAVLGPQALALRFGRDGMGARLLIVNLGADHALTPMPEPLLAPPGKCHWDLQWSSEETQYGGRGQPPLQTQPAWRLLAESAVLLRPAAGVVPPAPGSKDESD